MDGARQSGHLGDHVPQTAAGQAGEPPKGGLVVMPPHQAIAPAIAIAAAGSAMGSTRHGNRLPRTVAVGPTARPHSGQRSGIGEPRSPPLTS